jgi:hypothetical protein
MPGMALWQLSSSLTAAKLLPNTLVNLTRYGRRRKPGRAGFQHLARPGLQHLPTRSGYRER